MKRSASLDFLRGAAAFAVAIPHYLTANAPFQPYADAFAIAGVEVFFVLSGFVLAPQIVDWVVGKPWRNLGVFLVRRWMRTIPPYVVALVVIALLTGNLMTADFVRYLFYVENLFSSANHVDFYPVAWSLAVEEWFYVLFAPAPVSRRAAARETRPAARGDLRGPGHCCRRGAAALVRAARLGPERPPRHAFSDQLHRLGLLALSHARASCADWRSSAASGRWRLGALLALLAVAIPGRARRRDPGCRRRRHGSAGLSLRLGGVRHDRSRRLLAGRGPFRNRVVRGVSFYLGRISYSVYLFHLIVIMALKPLIADAARLATRALCARDPGALDGLLAGFERPILAARPYYGGRGARAAARPSRRTANLTASVPSLVGVALGLAALAAGVLARNAFMADKPYVFYPLLSRRRFSSLRLRRRARPLRPARSRGGARLPSVRARAAFRRRSLPPLDRIAAVATVAEPTYSYRAAHANPTAFATWWFYYLNEWIREDGIRAAIDAPDPQKKLPFVQVPGSSGRMFDTTIRINNLGFRGPDIARDKGNAFRIVALGESQTFGPTLRDGEKPWPELLQDLFDQHASCGRRIEVINAGTEAYTLEDNLERMRRDILPLKPDLIVSTHGMNGFFLRLEARARAKRAWRQAAGLGAYRPRVADDRARRT